MVLDRIDTLALPGCLRLLSRSLQLSDFGVDKLHYSFCWIGATASGWKSKAASEHYYLLNTFCYPFVELVSKYSFLPSVYFQMTLCKTRKA